MLLVRSLVIREHFPVKITPIDLWKLRTQILIAFSIILCHTESSYQKKKKQKEKSAAAGTPNHPVLPTAFPTGLRLPVRPQDSPHHKGVENPDGRPWKRPWTNPFISIYNGAKYIANNFSKTQNTGYLQKFNVNPASSNMYGHEYMANVQAAASEALNTYNAYSSAGLLSTEKTFLIIKKYIDDNFTSCDLSLNCISKELLYNPKYISGLFKKKMNIGLVEYINTIRIQYACTLISQGFTSVKELAVLSGYKDALYFSKVFKKKMGVSPKQYIFSLH